MKKMAEDVWGFTRACVRKYSKRAKVTVKRVFFGFGMIGETSDEFAIMASNPFGWIMVSHAVEKWWRVDPEATKVIIRFATAHEIGHMVYWRRGWDWHTERMCHKFAEKMTGISFERFCEAYEKVTGRKFVGGN